jgi:hypothetical protein
VGVGGSYTNGIFVLGFRLHRRHSLMICRSSSTGGRIRRIYARFCVVFYEFVLLIRTVLRIQLVQGLHSIEEKKEEEEMGDWLVVVDSCFPSLNVDTDLFSFVRGAGGKKRTASFVYHLSPRI